MNAIEPLDKFYGPPIVAPILTSQNSIRAAERPGSVCGTLTLVRVGKKVFAVTAHHVLRRWKDSVLGSSVLHENQILRIREYQWERLTYGVSDESPDGELDLAFAELSDKQIADVASSLILPIARGSKIKSRFQAIVVGYPSKINDEYDLQRTTYPRPLVYEVGVKPYNPLMQTDCRFEICFNRKKAAIWEDNKYTSQGYVAPKPKGLSGAPLLYYGRQVDNFCEVDKRSVVGIFLTQNEKSMMASAVLSDVLLDLIV